MVSEATARAALRKGFYIEMGNHSGYRLTGGQPTSRKRISGRLVKKLDAENFIRRSDDSTSCIGKTWAISPYICSACGGVLEHIDERGIQDHVCATDHDGHATDD